jgi:hypothetical protein
MYVQYNNSIEGAMLIQLFKMQNYLTPASSSTLIPNRFQDVHTYNTRHNNAFPLPRTRISLYASYFQFRGISPQVH